MYHEDDQYIENRQNHNDREVMINNIKTRSYKLKMKHYFKSQVGDPYNEVECHDGPNDEILEMCLESGQMSFKVLYMVRSVGSPYGAIIYPYLSNIRKSGRYTSNIGRNHDEDYDPLDCWGVLILQ